MDTFTKIVIATGAFITIFTIALIASSQKTYEEKIAEFNALQPICEAQGKDTLTELNGNTPYCSYRTRQELCMMDYIDSIDEKYNNPDIVSHLQESGFVEALKACKEATERKLQEK